VLLVGNQPVDVVLRRDLARTGDLEILTVGTGAEGLRVARLQTPDTVVLRASLPDIHGVEVCQQLHDDPLTEAIPVIVVGDAGPSGAGSHPFGASAVAVVPAEIDPARLCHLVQMVLTTRLARRTHPRVDLQAGVDYASESTRGTARTLNISVGGAFIAVATPLDVGTSLDLCFALPGGDPLEVHGQVVWIRRPNDEHPFPAGMAVQFSGLAEEAAAAIAAYVAKSLTPPRLAPGVAA
jgi:uncharacterized protein (TIGR02266 family)